MCKVEVARRINCALLIMAIVGILVPMSFRRIKFMSQMFNFVVVSMVLSVLPNIVSASDVIKSPMASLMTSPPPSHWPKEIKIVSIITYNNSRLFSMDRVRPGLEIAIDRIYDLHLIPPSINVTVNFSDSHCNPKDGPVAAFNYIMRKDVHFFLGPVCDYSLAPIARYAPYWDIPIASPGGFAHDFGFNKSLPDAEFPSLTRVGMTFNSMSRAVTWCMKTNGWQKVTLIYEGDGQSDISPRFCYLAGSALIAHWTKEKQIRIEIHLIKDKDYGQMLREKVGINNAGKYGFLFVCVLFVHLAVRLFVRLFDR